MTTGKLAVSHIVESAETCKLSKKQLKGQDVLNAIEENATCLAITRKETAK